MNINKLIVENTSSSSKRWQLLTETLLIYFILSASFSYSQALSGKALLKMDSLFKAIDKKNNETIGKQFPEFSVFNNKEECSNSKLKGKVVFINFWFSKCAPCIAEFDQLNKLFEKYKENKKFELISFTFESPAEINLMKKKYNIKYQVFSITGSECNRLNFNNSFPTNIIVDSLGSVKFIHSGGQLDKSEIKKYFTTTIYPLISKEL